MSDVWIAGRHVLKERELTTIELPDLLEEISYWRERIACPPSPDQYGSI